MKDHRASTSNMQANHKFSLFQDWQVNKGNAKGRVILVAYRAANFFTYIPLPFRYVGYPYLIAYRVFVEWILGVELPWKLRVGVGLRLHHGQALVVNDRAIIGNNCLLRHSTTIGVGATSIDYSGAAPVIGDNVDVGSNVVILGSIYVGDGAVIGAGSVVLNDVPAGAVVVGNPARVLRITE
jgi:putative colanic acid biosynthesis acetyltransferase WcaB